MQDDEVAVLLQIEVETWRSFRDGSSDVLFDAWALERMGHCVDISDAIKVLQPGADEAVYLRVGHPILFGATPLYYLLADEDALRSIRWTMMTEADPTFPGSIR